MTSSARAQPGLRPRSRPAILRRMETTTGPVRRRDAALTDDGIVTFAYQLDPETGCWLWLRLVRSGGYPRPSGTRL